MSFNFLIKPRRRERSKLRVALIASVVVHVGLIALMGFNQKWGVARKFYAPLHMVELAAPPPSAPAPRPAPSPKPVAKPAPKPKPKPIAKPKPRPVAKPKVKQIPVEKADPKPKPKPEYTEENLQDRLERLRQKYAEEEEPQPERRDVRSAIDRIRDRVGEVEEAPPSPLPPGPVQEATTAQTAPRGGPRGSAMGQMRFSAYKNKLWAHIQKQWLVPPALKGKEGLSVIIALNFERDGTITEYWVDQSSGSKAYDEAAKKAIVRSSPLPPIPSDIPDEAFEDGIGFRFQE